MNKCLIGDVREVLPTLEAGSVQMCVTSPPYWGLRDYGVDGQLGLEFTPEEFVANMVAVFREVRRVLADDGTLWLNLGDAYAHGSSGGGGPVDERRDGRNTTPGDKVRGRMGGANTLAKGLKPKDLIGIPWMVAKALQAPYYTGDITRERDRVWLASMLDGEGTICGFRHERKDDGRVRTGAHVFITNSHAGILDEAHRIWPTSRSEHMRPSAGHLGKQTVYRWIAHNADRKARLLSELYPYLIAKKQQSLIAWNLLQFVKDGKRLGRGLHGPETREKRDRLVELLAQANAGKPVIVPSWCHEPPSMHEPGWYLRQDIVWSKPNPMPESVTDRCTKSHEYVFLLSKSARYWFDAEAIREKAEYGRRDWGGSDQHAAYMRSRENLQSRGERKTPENYTKGADPEAGRNKRSVWTVNSAPYAEAHFATFPPKLIEPCILAGSRSGEVVLDPFFGSGTTGEVCERLGRQWLGVELNPEYAEMAKRRTAQMGLGL